MLCFLEVVFPEAVRFLRNEPPPENKAAIGDIGSGGDRPATCASEVRRMATGDEVNYGKEKQENLQK